MTKTSSDIRTYTELSRLKTFAERYEYLKLRGSVGVETFGRDRWLNQLLYTNKEWRDVRRKVIVRDNFCDLGVSGYDFLSDQQIIVHHMNPIQLEDLVDTDRLSLCLDPEYLVATSLATHNGIHYGIGLLPPCEVSDRCPYDTAPWRKR